MRNESGMEASNSLSRSGVRGIFKLTVIVLAVTNARQASLMISQANTPIPAGRPLIAHVVDATFVVGVDPVADVVAILVVANGPEIVVDVPDFDVVGTAVLVDDVALVVDELVRWLVVVVSRLFFFALVQAAVTVTDVALCVAV